MPALSPNRLQILANKTVMKKNIPSILFSIALFTGDKCWAGTSSPIDFGLFFLFVAIFVFAIVLGLLILLWREKGFIVFLVLITAIWIWLNGISDKAAVKQASRLSEVKLGQQTVSEACFNNGGETGGSISYKPARVVVRVDSELQPGGHNRLMTAVGTNNPSPNVEFVQSFPSERAVKTAYVDIALIKEPLKHPIDWTLDGIQTTIISGDGSIVAKRIDYRGNLGWCMGGTPPESLEHFLRARLGQPIGIATLTSGSTANIEVKSPKGAVTPLEKGKFSEILHTTDVGQHVKMREKMRLIPDYVGCSFQGGSSPDDSAMCLQGTPRNFSIDLRKLSSTYELPNSWLSIFPNPNTFIDSITIVERGKNGDVLNNWHVRFPFIDSAAFTSSNFEVRNVSVANGRFTADLLFSREVAKEVSRNASPSISESPYKEWYGYRSVITVDLSNN